MFEFIPTYHEWDLYKNGELIYSFDNIGEMFTGEATEEEAKSVAVDLAEAVEDEDGKQLLSAEERQEASKAIFEAIKKFYL